MKGNDLAPNQNIQYIVKETFSETTIHGIVPIIKRQSILIRIIWVFCLVASAVVCAYMIFLSISAYFSHDTVTKTYQVYLISAELPAVTICNINPFMTSEGIQFVREILTQNQILKPNETVEDAFARLSSSDLLFMRYLTGSNAVDPNRTDQFRKSLGYSMQDMLFNCQHNMVPCTSNDFSWFFDVLSGNCFTINLGRLANGSASPLMTATKPGAVNGISMELFLYEPENVTTLSVSTGLRVVVHNQTHFPILNEGIFIPTGFQNQIEVNRVFSSHLEKPYSDCMADIGPNYPSKFVKAILKTNFTYNQQTCFFICFQSYLVDECGCYDTATPLAMSTLTKPNARPCLTYEETKCDAKFYVKFFESDVERVCVPGCPLECDSVRYILSTNQADYPSQVYMSSLMKNAWIREKYASNLSQLTSESLKRNMVYFSVYYGNLGYDFYEETEKTSVIDLVASIGGTLGLFLGMSFLSLIEFVDVLLQILLRKSEKSKNLVFP